MIQNYLSLQRALVPRDYFKQDFDFNTASPNSNSLLFLFRRSNILLKFRCSSILFMLQKRIKSVVLVAVLHAPAGYWNVPGYCTPQRIAITEDCNHRALQS